MTKEERTMTTLAGQIDLLRRMVEAGDDPAQKLAELERVWQALYYTPYSR